MKTAEVNTPTISVMHHKYTVFQSITQCLGKDSFRKKAILIYVVLTLTSCI